MEIIIAMLIAYIPFFWWVGQEAYITMKDHRLHKETQEGKDLYGQ